MSATGARTRAGDVKAAAARLAVPSVFAGLLGGLFMIVVMILVTGTSGMGYASPLNLGMPAFVSTITPPLSMLPKLMAAMGITLPAPVMAQLAVAIHAGHIPPAMMAKLGPMLMSMHVPASEVHMMGLLMTGHATNSTVAALMSHMSPAARAMVMSAMPVSAAHVVVGTILHFAFAAFLGVAFFGIIGAAAWLGLPGMRTSAGLVAASVAGGAIVYVVNRWALLPPTNPMMALVPQIAFFLAHLLFGLVVGVVLAAAFQRGNVAGLLPASQGHRLSAA
ncbi:MAG: hypothetical protein M0Z95_01290 [Actinomycetota bacterium]|nr:hypothetical protein [Actinomycetota bacterium]